MIATTPSVKERVGAIVAAEARERRVVKGLRQRTRRLRRSLESRISGAPFDLALSRRLDALTAVDDVLIGWDRPAS